jgi:hypothetical protein
LALRHIMPTSPDLPTVFLIGTDAMLAYLLGRFTEQCNFRMVTLEAAPSVNDIVRDKAAAVIFATIGHLEADQDFVDAMSTHEIPVLVCTSLTDEARARELGADECLMHPLTYNEFCTTLSGIGSSVK